MRSLIRRIVPAKYHLVTRLEKKVVEYADSCIVSGPFEGMRYVAESVGSRHPPKLLGTYEIELRDIIDEIVTKKPAVIFNIGAAEGYYTVGLARALPETRVLTWEISETGRALSKTLAECNGVDDGRIELHGFCSVSGLQKRFNDFHAPTEIVLLVDIEGGEAMLLDPEVIPRLRKCEMIIEVHECFIHGVQELLVNRFCETHSILEIKAKERSLADWPKKLNFLDSMVWNNAKVALMNECRPKGMSWLYLRKL